jgi:mannosyl-oligosaccharide alpha-1,2-mannosidase
MLALGAIELDRPDDLVLAKKLGDTCHMLYADQQSGIGPEKVRFDKTANMQTGKPAYRILSAAYYLRPGTFLFVVVVVVVSFFVTAMFHTNPETIESFFILYRMTGDPKYREWGWNIFQVNHIYLFIFFIFFRN